MLSTTYSVADVKIQLGSVEDYDYSYFGFHSDPDYITVITEALRKAEYEDMYPIINSTNYDLVAAEDRTSLSDEETYVYYAEIYFAVAQFYEQIGRKETAGLGVNANDPRLPGQIQGKLKAAAEWRQKATRNLDRAGYATRPRAAIRSFGIYE